MRSGKHRKLTIEDHRNIVDLLRHDVFKGWHYFHIFYMLDRVYYPTQYPKSEFFFSGAASACRDFTFLIVARLLDSQAHLGLRSFNRVLRQGLSDLAPDMQLKIETDLDRLTTILAESRSVENQIRDLRNNQIAHVSMDYVQVSDAFKSIPPVKMDEVRTFYRDTFDLLNSIAVHLGMEAKSLDNIAEATIRNTQSVLGER